LMVLQQAKQGNQIVHSYKNNAAGVDSHSA
jgi:hypothetical protein